MLRFIISEPIFSTVHREGRQCAQELEQAENCVFRHYQLHQPGGGRDLEHFLQPSASNTYQSKDSQQRANHPKKGKHLNAHKLKLNLIFIYTFFQSIATIKSSTPQKTPKVISADNDSDVSSTLDIVHMDVSY